MRKITGLLKSPRAQSISIISLAILLGVGTYIYLLNYQSSLERKNQLVPVYVATSDIPSGTSLQEMQSRNLITLKNFPQKSIPTTAVSDLASISPALTTKGLLVSGQIVTTTFFTSVARTEVSLPIPPGMLAVSVSIDDVGRVANFVLPGSRVVVYATGAAGSSSEPGTRVLLSEALVLGIGNQTGLSLSSTSLVASPLVTLAVTPRDAERLILASQNLRISLALAYENNPAPLISNFSQATKSNLFNS